MKRSLEELEIERMDWSRKTFPEATAMSSLEKLKQEIKEVEDEYALDLPEFFKQGELAEEYSDCLMCIFDSAGRAGITVTQIRDAFEKKLEKNKARKWQKNDDNTYSHVKD